MKNNHARSHQRPQLIQMPRATRAQLKTLVLLEAIFALFPTPRNVAQGGAPNSTAGVVSLRRTRELPFDRDAEHVLLAARHPAPRGPQHGPLRGPPRLGPVPRSALAALALISRMRRLWRGDDAREEGGALRAGAGGLLLEQAVDRLGLRRHGQVNQRAGGRGRDKAVHTPFRPGAFSRSCSCASAPFLRGGVRFPRT